MHRTETPEPQFVPLTAGEVWVRVAEDTGYRHFHVAPQVGSGEMTVEEAVTKATELNIQDPHSGERFYYYPVRVTADREPVETPVESGRMVPR